jgi:hypothetical protein
MGVGITLGETALTWMLYGAKKSAADCGDLVKTGKPPPGMDPASLD